MTVAAIRFVAGGDNELLIRIPMPTAKATEIADKLTKAPHAAVMVAGATDPKIGHPDIAHRVFCTTEGLNAELSRFEADDARAHEADRG